MRTNVLSPRLVWSLFNAATTLSVMTIVFEDLVQSGRLVNPGFSFGRTTRGDEIEIERSFIMNIMSLLTMPIRTGIERRRFEVAKTRVAADATRIAADARRAYYGAVAAQEGVKYMEQVKEAAEASAEIARRMAAAGNFSKLDHAREQLFTPRPLRSSGASGKPLSGCAGWPSADRSGTSTATQDPIRPGPSGVGVSGHNRVD